MLPFLKFSPTLAKFSLFSQFNEKQYQYQIK